MVVHLRSFSKEEIPIFAQIEFHQPTSRRLSTPHATIVVHHGGLHGFKLLQKRARLTSTFGYLQNLRKGCKTASRVCVRCEKSSTGRPDFRVHEFLLTVEGEERGGNGKQESAACAAAGRAKFFAHSAKARNARAKGTLEEEAWDLLRAAIVEYCGSPVGTIAANDPTESNALNYDQVFIRDFIPSAMAFLLNGESEIVRNFLLHTLQLQVLIINLLNLLAVP